MIDLRPACRANSAHRSPTHFCLFVLNLKFWFMVVLPLLIVAFIVFAGLGGDVRARDARRSKRFRRLDVIGWSVIAGLTVPALVLLFVTVRLFPAWPMALATEEPKLFRGWAASKGKFWVLLGALILVYGITIALVLAHALISSLVQFTPTRRSTAWRRRLSLWCSCTSPLPT